MTDTIASSLQSFQFKLKLEKWTDMEKKLLYITCIYCVFIFSESLVRVSQNSWPLRDRTRSCKAAGQGRTDILKLVRFSPHSPGVAVGLCGRPSSSCSALGLKTTDLICWLYSPSAERLLFKQNMKWMVRRVGFGVGGWVEAALAITIVKTAPGWGGFQTKKSFSTKDCSSCRGRPF